MLEIENVSKTYNTNSKKKINALKDVSVKISKNEIVAITGTSGVGKSTLLHILGCVLSFDSGIYKIDGIEINSLSERAIAKIRNQKIGIIFQNFLLLQDNTVFENTEIPMIIAGVNRKTRKMQCNKALEQAGIADLAQRPVSELSGGQKQRVAIARAIVNNAEYILADEPTGALDSETSSKIFDLLCAVRDSGRGVVLVTHDQSLAAMCDRQIILKDGTIENNSQNQ
ncbi:MAG: ABC transporter ATP-binding protein [Oscillospiraceae bacterium]